MQRVQKFIGSKEKFILQYQNRQEYAYTNMNSHLRNPLSWVGNIIQSFKIGMSTALPILKPLNFFKASNIFILPC